MPLSEYSFPSNVPIIVEDDFFLYPFMISPIFLSDDKNIKAVNYAIEHNQTVMIVPSKEEHEGQRDFDAIYNSGVIGTIMRKVTLPDGRIKILFQGLAKGRIIDEVDTNPLIATVDLITTKQYDSSKVVAILNILREKIKYLSNINQQFSPDLIRAIDENDEPNRIADLISSYIKLKKEQAYRLFIEENIELRLFMLIDLIVENIESSKLQKEIRSKVNVKIEKVNREYFLKEQLKQIQNELGIDNQRDEEIEEYRKKLEKIKKYLDEDAIKEITKQIDRLSKMHPESADASLIQNYIEWVLELPFGKYSTKKLDILEVQKHLDKDHYSLEKAKERIVEFFAVRELLNLRGKSDKSDRGTILCFAGPPGVGKTSLANSIATALKRSLVRIALGGLEDVNELRGHRRTYIGAMPGRIIQGLIDAKEMNPVVVLDEIDKVGRSFRGDPTAALLEILDPEQNEKFRDHYVNFNIDLSKVIFIATANDISSIPTPLRDRMEIIMVSSYTPQEKFQIAKKYLIPQELKRHGLTKEEIKISDDALKEVIEKYTREAGVRNLRRQIAKVFRKCAKQIVQNSETKKINISLKNYKEFLDKMVFEIDEIDKESVVGVVNGLAWTSVGGDVLKVESVKIQGKGVVQITGSLGDVMKESSKIAYSVVKVLIDENKLKIDEKLIPKNAKEESENTTLQASEIYKRYDLHIHVPEGATPKDGPSAGITMATCIASILSNQKVKADVAMTGEITLTGKVLPIGGLKEKLIAAYKAKIKQVLIPKKNFERDLDDIPEEVKQNLEIIAVSTIDEVLNRALIKE